ncbi:hypothetical protein FB385_2655 [Paramicrobacterium agarici]|nr:hypothetical protein FB385_2655 [Microbacterium agarici]
MIDPFTVTQDALTREEVRTALQRIPVVMFDCPVCHWPYRAEWSAEVCCEDVVPRD